MSVAVQQASIRPAVAAQYHSALAMQAAQQMRSSKQKLKTGQKVCHHLRMMLTSNPVPAAKSANSEPQYTLGF